MTLELLGWIFVLRWGGEERAPGVWVWGVTLAMGRRQVEV